MAELVPQQQPTIPPLTPQQKAQFNSFIDFIEKEGYKGAPILDDKNQKIGQYLFQKYQSLNPNLSISYKDIPRVQQELQDYRTNLVNQWKNNPKLIPDAKSEDEIMQGLSPVDGWLGSKTTSHKFPIATGTVIAPNGQQTVQNYGTDIAAFDKKFLGRGTNK